MFSYVLEGRVGAVMEGREVVAETGSLLFKPRGLWHTFWNFGNEPAVCLELISPAGPEELSPSFAGLTEPPAPDVLPGLAREYGCELDFQSTMPLVERLLEDALGLHDEAAVAALLAQRGLPGGA